jgi:hypothetical protein
MLCFDVYDFGIARAEAAQSMAYWSGIAFLVEDLLPFVIGRPSAVAAVIPAGDPCGSGSKCNAVGHCAFPFKSALSPSCKLRTPAHPDRRHRTDWAKKRETCAESGHPPGATTTAGRLSGELLGSRQDRRFFDFCHLVSFRLSVERGHQLCLAPIKNWFEASFHNLLGVGRGRRICTN